MIRDREQDEAELDARIMAQTGTRDTPAPGIDTGLRDDDPSADWYTCDRCGDPVDPDEATYLRGDAPYGVICGPCAVKIEGGAR